MRRQVIFLASLLLLLNADLPAQDKSKLEPDKPDQSDGQSVVEKKSLQLETSFYYNAFKQGPAAFIASNLLRYGVLKHIELRLLVEQGVQRERYFTETVQAGYPLALSAKFELSEEQKLLPSLSLISYLQLPFTNTASQHDCWSTAFIMALEKKIADLTLTVNAGLKQETYDYTWKWYASGDLKYDLGPKTEVFTEYFAQYGKQEAPFHNFDAGILYHLTKKFLLHLAAGRSIFYSPHNYFVNTGFAVKIK